MNSSPAILRRSPSRSAGRLDRDRQAAPQVFERLRKLITSLALPPGSPLSRNALAEQFGVSSTPIRDALMRLEEEGLVEVFPQYATVVSRIDIGLAQQAHFLRQALELEIVKRLALEHSERLVDELNTTIARQQKFAKAGDFEKFMAADNDFHRAALCRDRQPGTLGSGAQPQRSYRPAAPAASALARQGAGHRAPSPADRESNRREPAG